MTGKAHEEEQLQIKKCGNESLDIPDDDPWLKEWLKMITWVTVVCGFWLFGPFLFLGVAAYMFYIWFNFAATMLALYLVWFYLTWDWPERGCLPIDWVRNGFWYRWEGEYFNYRVVKTAELPPDRNYIVGSHPHGMICLGMALSFVSHTSGMRELYAGLKLWTVTLAGQFLWPVRREIMMAGGSGIVSKRNLEWILRQEEMGQAVTIVVGGINEGMMTAAGKHRLKLRSRKGFIKLALAEGADLVPMYHFGENNTYTPVTGICLKRLRNMQAHIVNRFGFCVPLLMGSSLFGLPWGGLVPNKTRMESVIGSPIHVEKNPNPTQEEVDSLHAMYCDKLIELFENHKANYGIPPEERIIIY